MLYLVPVRLSTVRVVWLLAAEVVSPTSKVSYILQSLHFKEIMKTKVISENRKWRLCPDD